MHLNRSAGGTEAEGATSVAVPVTEQEAIASAPMIDRVIWPEKYAPGHPRSTR